MTTEEIATTRKLVSALGGSLMEGMNQDLLVVLEGVGKGELDLDGFAPWMLSLIVFRVFIERQHETLPVGKMVERGVKRIKEYYSALEMVEEVQEEIS